MWLAGVCCTVCCNITLSDLSCYFCLLVIVCSHTVFATSTRLCVRNGLDEFLGAWLARVTATRCFHDSFGGSTCVFALLHGVWFVMSLVLFLVCTWSLNLKQLGNHKICLPCWFVTDCVLTFSIFLLLVCRASVTSPAFLQGVTCLHQQVDRLC